MDRVFSSTFHECHAVVLQPGQQLHKAAHLLLPIKTHLLHMLNPNARQICQHHPTPHSCIGLFEPSITQNGYKMGQQLLPEVSRLPSGGGLLIYGGLYERVLYSYNGEMLNVTCDVKMQGSI